MTYRINGMTAEELKEVQLNAYNENREVHRAGGTPTEDNVKREYDAKMALLAIDDAKYVAMSPQQRQQCHIDAGLIPYDDSAYTDESVLSSLVAREGLRKLVVVNE